MILDRVRALVFDVFGTVVDWRSGIARDAAPFLVRHARSRVDPAAPSGVVVRVALPLTRVESELGRLSRVNGDLYFLRHDSTEPYPLEDESFEWAYSEHFIEHIELQEAIARRIAGTLAANVSIIEGHRGHSTLLFGMPEN